MTTSSLLRDYAAYNHWANARFIEWIRTMPAETLDTSVASSFPSLRLTLLHIWDAELIWLSRLQGSMPTGFPSKTFQGTTDELFEGLLRNSAGLHDYLDAQPDEFFSGKTAYRLLDGTESAQTRAEILLHVFQHSTLHRGQLITMGRGLGFSDPPKSDYIYYVRTSKSVPEKQP